MSADPSSTRYAAQIPRVIGAVFANERMRRVQLAFAGFNCAEWAVWIAMLVYAYSRGGATETGIVALAQLLPAAVLAPLAAVVGDRREAAHILFLGYVAQALAMAATGAVLLASGPALLAYALAAGANTAVAVTRPAQAAVLPALAHVPEELTAANVVSNWIESVSVLVAPALTGVLLAVANPGTVFVSMAVVVAASALLVAPLARVRAVARPASGGGLDEVLAGFRALRAAPQPRLLVGLLGAQYVVIGALDVLCVVLAVSVLDLGDPGAGYLNAAFGPGGAVGIVATVALVGRRRLLRPLLLGITAWTVAFVAIGIRPTTIAAFLLLAVAGAGRSLFDVSGRTLLQRTAPGELLSRVFGVVEGLSMAGLALGSLLAPALVALGGARAAFIGVAAVLPLAVALGRRGLPSIEQEARQPVVETALLRLLPLFAPLGAPALATLAGSLEPVRVAAGTAVIRQGEEGDRFYVVAYGELDVLVDGSRVNKLGRAAGFGEIALLRRVPRTASVVARADSLLYALGKPAFLAAVTGCPQTAVEAERHVDELLRAVPRVAR